MTSNIPRELQELPQWVAAGEDKVPIDPRTGRNADPTLASTWGTFEEASRTGLKHIGFVLTRQDPFTIIDLDYAFERKDKSAIVEGDPEWDEACNRQARQDAWVQQFDSYTEWSQSGRGRHIVVRGHIPKGVRRDKIEIYSDSRYIICTGNVIHNAPIVDRQEFLTAAYSAMDQSQRLDALEQHDSRFSDSQIYDLAAGASNADKFHTLCKGDWESMLIPDGEHAGKPLYDSQSEADLALMTILAYYTRDNQQVARLFRYSALGQRDKARRDDYVDYALRLIRSKQPALVDTASILQAPAAEAVPINVSPQPESESQPMQPLAPAPQPEDGYTFPPGLVGDIAEYTMRFAVRPCKEIALAAGLALTAGIAARSYNISKTGLNHYVLVLAGTGSGKEAISQVIDSLISTLRMKIPVADQFVGPGAFASGQALSKAVAERPCFVSVLGEVGLTLQRITHARASGAELAYKQELLMLYSQSGWHQTKKATVYSDKEKNTKIIQAPNFTFVGESVPEEFYAALNEEQIKCGLVPRFTIIEYKGDRPELNDDAFAPPPEQLMLKLEELITIAITTQQNATCAPVQLDADARKMMRDWNLWVDGKFDGAKDTLKQIWNRAHLKALKLAGLVAVGCNPHSPTVTKEVATWAIDFVHREATMIANRFSSGQVGEGHAKQYSEVTRLMQDYLKLPSTSRKNYKAPFAIWTLQIVPLAYLTTRVRSIRFFTSNPNKTPRQVLEGILKEMVEEEVITQIAQDQTLALYKSKMPMYLPGPNWSQVDV